MERLSSQCIEENRMKKESEVWTYNPSLMQNIFLIKLFGLIGVIVTMFFASILLYNGNIVLSMILIIVSAILIVNYFVLIKLEKYNIASNILVYIFLCLFLYLVYSGGVQRTGALWIYIFPILALFLQGFKHGLIDIGICILGIISIFYVLPPKTPLIAVYSDTFKSQLLFSFTLVSFLASLYEFFRVKSCTQVCELSKKLVKISKEEHLSELTRKRCIGEECEILFADAKKHNENMSVVLVDIDYLSDIKRRYGDSIEEIIVDKITHKIKNCIKNDDALIRWTGAEFLILLPYTTYDSAHKFAEELKQRIKNMTLKYDNNPIHMTLTTGVADILNNNSIYTTIRNANNEMYSI